MFELVDARWIGQHFVTYIHYGDSTGLTDEEEKQINNYIGRYDLVETTREASFAKCSVTGYLSDCVKTCFYMLIHEEE